MKQYPAVATIEFGDIAAGAAATDAMLKKAPIAFFRCGTITDGRYLTLIGGTTASVEESFGEGLRHAAGHVLDSVVLLDVDHRLYDAVQGARRGRGAGALAVIETGTVSASIRGAEAALKGTPVELLEIRLGDSGLAGRGLALYQGPLHDVEAAVQLAVAQARRGTVRVSSRIIAAPYEALVSQLEHGTGFATALTVALEGEHL
jgi:microcompartment protein CcmL/EutN